MQLRKVVTGVGNITAILVVVTLRRHFGASRVVLDYTILDDGETMSDDDRRNAVILVDNVRLCRGGTVTGTPGFALGAKNVVTLPLGADPKRLAAGLIDILAGEQVPDSSTPQPDSCL